MQREVMELQYLRERTDGYKKSVHENQALAEKEREEKELQLAQEQAEQERTRALEQRRKELLESLPAEPDSHEQTNVIIVALRFGDGRSGRRRFFDSVEMDVLFNWVDAVFGLAREEVVLTTMTGHKRFTFQGDSGLTLKGAGFGKMVGMRVSERNVTKTADDASREEECASSNEENIDDEDEYDSDDES